MAGRAGPLYRLLYDLSGPRSRRRPDPGPSTGRGPGQISLIPARISR